ncbi:hypothetical protein [Deinococcus altitudinis]|uniref:hypothetical protein n=1 Tax=Deinococcus altitudinis TaxID=468914 RepID=UPI00389263EF
MAQDPIPISFPSRLAGPHGQSDVLKLNMAELIAASELPDLVASDMYATLLHHCTLASCAVPRRG